MKPCQQALYILALLAFVLAGWTFPFMSYNQNVVSYRQCVSDCTVFHTPYTCSNACAVRKDGRL